MLENIFDVLWIIVTCDWFSKFPSLALSVAEEKKSSLYSPKHTGKIPLEVYLVHKIIDISDKNMINTVVLSIV